MLESSTAAYEKARAIPGRASTRSKAPGKFFDVGRGPLYCVGGTEGIIKDADGNSYIDMLAALGAVSLGYGYGPDTSAFGHAYSLPHVAEGACAQAMVEHVAPWASNVRFTRTGSEATHAAYRIARRATGRKHVLVGDWAYHGWHSWCERSPSGKPEDDNTFLFPHGGDLGETHTGAPTDVAAVFIEPHRWEPINIGWLRSIRDWCTKHGAMLVFDEMIYGGRWALGGATEYFRIVPDMACFGKAFGNGSPFACVVGGEVVRDHGEIVSGTYGGDVPSLMQATWVIQRYVAHDIVHRLWTLGEALQHKLRYAVEHSDWKNYAFVEGAPVHQRLRFVSGFGMTSEYLGREFSARMADQGVLWHPACANVCAAHTIEQMGIVATAAETALRNMKDQL